MTQIRLRQDTATNWSSSSSITPALGEPCIQTDGEKYLKIGDGTNKFNNLPYFVQSTELGDLDDLTTENKDTFVDAINEIVTNGGNKDLSNLTTTGVNKLQAVKAYASNGELLTDADGLADVKNYAHSTFDLSKFTVVGSPNITNDGIASGFSSSNYLKIPVIDRSKPFVQIIKFTTDNTIADSKRLLAEDTNTTYVSRIQFANRKISLFLTSDGASFDIATGSSYYSIDQLNYNTTYYLRFSWTGTQYLIDLSTDGKTYTSQITVNSTKSLRSLPVLIGSWGGEAFSGSIDLKQFSITVDGVEVFSGNKTGIDTVKPDDYTTVGTPTISADGIASGFQNGTNYLRTSVKTTDLLNKSWKITAKFRPSDVISPQALQFFKLSNPSSNAGVEGWSAMGFNSNNNYLVFSYKTGDSTESSNQLYKIINLAQYLDEWVTASYEFNFNTGIYTFKALREDGTLIAEQSYTAETTNKQLYYINTESTYIVTIGTGYSGTATTGGKIDLNAFKIYVDGNLVYQPCLKIPYAESKTGSKIVDAIYRDRVNDMADQFGFANYYTLQDEAKGNYTVVGSPTISSDFVASGFSASDYLTFNNVAIGNKFKFTCEVYLTNLTDTITPILVHSNLNRILLSTDGSLTVFANKNDSGTSAIANIFRDNPLQINIPYLLEVTCDGNTNWNFKYTNLNNNTTVTETKTYSDNFISSPAFWAIGSDAGRYLRGSIDLKEFKIYVDNELAYEAVIDPNFTLPQVELYGLIGQRTLRDSYRNGINYWELYSNRDLEQGGSCTSGVEITFARPFADTNYVLSVPYSAKSATAFTPTQTGDWIAKGKGVL